MEAGFDAYMRLFNAKGVQIRADDDEGGGTHALISFRPSRAGTYYVICTSTPLGATDRAARGGSGEVALLAIAVQPEREQASAQSAFIMRRFLSGHAHGFSAPGGCAPPSCSPALHVGCGSSIMNRLPHLRKLAARNSRFRICLTPSVAVCPRPSRS